MAHMKDHQVHGLSSDEANMTSQMTACQPEQIYQSSFHPPTPPTPTPTPKWSWQLKTAPRFS